MRRYGKISERYVIVRRMPMRVVERDRRRVLRPDEEADGRRPLEQQPAEVGERRASRSRGRAAPARPRPAGAGRPARVHADASALKRTRPSSPQSQLRPCSICVRVRQRRAPGRARTRRSRPPRGTPRPTAGTSRSRSASVAGRRPLLAGRRRLVEDEDGLAGPVVERARQPVARSRPRARSRPAPRRRSSAAPSASCVGEAAVPAPDGTRFAPTWQSAMSRPPSSKGDEAAEPAPRDVLEEDALDRLLGAEREDVRERRRCERARRDDNASAHRPTAVIGPPPCRSTSAPSPGDYAEACLLPGDPLRAKHIAETFLDDPRQENRGARHARLHRHLQRQAGLRAGDRDGLPVRRDRRRGARPARREAAPAGRHLRRPPARPRARRAHRRPVRRSCGLDADAPTSAASRTRRPRTGSSCTGPSTRPRRSASGCASGRSSRATSSTTRTRGSTSAGPTRGILAVEMEAACSSPSARCAKSRPAASSSSATSSSRASRADLATRTCARRSTR